MEQLGVVVIQLEEAKRFLLMERAEYHRLSLVLLDNAAELQLLRVAEGLIRHDELMDRIAERAREVGRQKAEPLPRELQSLNELVPMTNQRKRDLRRFFSDKLKYLGTAKGKIAPDVAEVLGYLHDSRNRVYHGGTLQQSIVRPLSILLFELNCRLLETLPPATSWASNQDYSWLGRYGLDPKRPRLDRSTASTIASSLRDGLPCEVDLLRDPLVCDCKTRLGRLDDALEFIARSSPVLDDRGSHLKAAQYYRHVTSEAETWSPEGFARYRPRYGIRFLNRCKSRVADVKREATGIGVFREFARLSRDIEMIETDVLAFASDIDDYIQYKIDKARGK